MEGDRVVRNAGGRVTRQGVVEGELVRLITIGVTVRIILVVVIDAPLVLDRVIVLGMDDDTA